MLKFKIGSATTAVRIYSNAHPSNLLNGFRLWIYVQVDDYRGMLNAVLLSI